MNYESTNHKRLRDSPSRYANALPSPSAIALQINESADESDILELLSSRPDIPSPIIQLFSRYPSDELVTAVLTFQNEQLAHAAIDTILVSNPYEDCIFYGDITPAAPFQPAPTPLIQALCPNTSRPDLLQHPIPSCAITGCRHCTNLTQATFTSENDIQQHYLGFHPHFFQAAALPDNADVRAILDWHLCPKCNLHLACSKANHLHHHIHCNSGPHQADINLAMPAAVPPSTITLSPLKAPAATRRRHNDFIHEYKDIAFATVVDARLHFPQAFAICPLHHHQRLCQRITPLSTNSDVMGAASALAFQDKQQLMKND
jgi:hypothetical protein